MPSAAVTCVSRDRVSIDDRGYYSTVTDFAKLRG